mmetsp:Transcript_52785/g.126630  ORF Transcript_52785/g.126630 Transcript_52785/m.126630 type:complete len:205 (+) Transcript_52785:349-963(+)
MTSSKTTSLAEGWACSVKRRSSSACARSAKQTASRGFSPGGDGARSTGSVGSMNLSSCHSSSGHRLEAETAVGKGGSASSRWCTASCSGDGSRATAMGDQPACASGGEASLEASCSSSVLRSAARSDSAAVRSRCARSSRSALADCCRRVSTAARRSSTAGTSAAASSSSSLVSVSTIPRYSARWPRVAAQLALLITRSRGTRR